MSRQLFFVLLFALGMVVPLSAAELPNFTGSWEMPNSATSSFSLDLTQTKKRLAGYHSAVALGGRRIDAVLPNEGQPSIVGTVSGRVARVHFRSGYDDTGSGDVLLMLRPDGTIAWKIIRASGTHYLPKATTLYRNHPPPR